MLSLRNNELNIIAEGIDNWAPIVIGANIETNGWLAVFYAGAIISIFGHMMMFYLYKFYPVGMVLPFYALFPVFGLILTFLIFGEIPTLIMVTGGIIVILSVFMLQKIR